jgi:hypothetical protein
MVSDNETLVPSKDNVNWIYKFFEALSLSGAIIVMLFSLTVYGIASHQKEVYQSFGTAFCTFVTGKQLGKIEGK